MKRSALVSVLLCAIALFVGCSTKFEPTDVENVSISISDVSPTGATVIIKDSNEKPYLYGSWYKIEREDGGKWTAVETVIDNYGFDAVGYLPNGDGEMEFTENWEWLYGQLPPGRYRILKKVNNQYISAEFTVGTE